MTTTAPTHRAQPTRAAAGAPVGRGALGWVGRVVAWVVILGSAAVLAAAVVVPRVAGATPFTILTGSMRPGLPPGTLVVTRPTSVDEIGIGSVITYQLRSGDPTVVTHRVVALRTDLSGRRQIQTKGDANDSPDPRWVRPVQVRGALWYSVPYVGRAGALLTSQDRSRVLDVAAVGLLGYAGWMFVRAGRTRRRQGATR